MRKIRKERWKEGMRAEEKRGKEGGNGGREGEEGPKSMA